MFYVHLENYDFTSQSDDLHSFILLATNWSRDRTNRWFGAKNEREEEEKNESSDIKGNQKDWIIPLKTSKCTGKWENWLVLSRGEGTYISLFPYWNYTWFCEF